ncbi:GNAT family N-acetyltransferase [Kocuria marina]
MSTPDTALEATTTATGSGGAAASAHAPSAARTGEGDPADLEIARAQASHAQGIVNLRDRLARWLQGRGIDQWREGEFDPAEVRREIDRGEWWVVESPVQPGLILASVRVIWADPEIWGEQPEPAGYTHGVAVDRSLAGTGTGARLIRTAERVIVESGRSVSRLDCDDDNPVLKRFYTGLGYTPRGAVDFSVPRLDYRVTLMRMERGLTP